MISRCFPRLQLLTTLIEGEGEFQLGTHQILKHILKWIAWRIYAVISFFETTFVFIGQTLRDHAQVMLPTYIYFTQQLHCLRSLIEMYESRYGVCIIFFTFCSLSVMIGTSLSLPPANEVCDGYVFTDVCLSTGRSLSGGSLSGGLCLGGLCPGRESLSGRPPWTETPPYGNKRAVRILLECILVLKW